MNIKRNKMRKEEDFLKNGWTSAMGSSLTEAQHELLNRGEVVYRSKGASHVKAFAKDCNGKLWSIIVQKGEKIL